MIIDILGSNDNHGGSIGLVMAICVSFSGCEMVSNDNETQMIYGSNQP